ncbi:MAG: glutathione peroxidase [Candidatus Marinimicrobia bacterium]|nr:glutathione peroxidase [Candidatus Neomarinimicrobiota bacterium]
MTFLKSTLKADPKIKSIKPFYDLSINDINGDLIDLKSFKGKKIMLVNVASKCGYTDQYSDLQELYQTHSEKLEIIGIPCNDFGRQEPGSAEEIKSFCNVNYGITFTLASKQKIKSKPISNLYEWLSNPELNGWNSALPSWNFCKYIIDEEGELIHFFRSGVNPNDSEILELL